MAQGDSEKIPVEGWVCEVHGKGFKIKIGLVHPLSGILSVSLPPTPNKDLHKEHVGNMGSRRKTWMCSMKGEKT